MMKVRVGDTATRSITLTDRHLEAFAEISGDRGDDEVVLEGEAWCYTFSPDVSAVTWSATRT